MPRDHLRPKLALALAVLFAGSLTPVAEGPGRPVEAHWHGDCDLATKRCAPDPEPPALPAEALYSGYLEPLQPYLDRDTYALLAGFLDGVKGEAPLPIPEELPDDVPLPVQASWEVERSLQISPRRASAEMNAVAHAKVFGAKVHVHEKAKVSVGEGAAEPGPAEPGQVPCGDPRGCPDLVVDASQMLIGTYEEEGFPPYSCALIEGMVGGPGMRRLLRFTFTTPNFGDGDLKIGAPGDHPEWFEWSPCHGHHHFRQYADYRLWTPQGYLDWRAAREQDPAATATQVLAAHPELQSQFVAGHKQGFCVIDITPYIPVEPAKYGDCFHDQGITVGWADSYSHLLDGQWVDVTDVAPGAYVLEAEVNAERLYQETDYANNAGAILVAVPPAIPFIDPGPILP